jgi:broad specificity phosphatase PhoE
MKIATDDRLIEMNYGKWSGKKLSFLSVRPLWRKIQSSPSDVTFPDGESFANMASRVGSLLEELHRKYPKESLLLVTHGDICKFIATYFLKLPLNDLQKFLVKPASLSIYHQTSEKIAVEVFNSSAIKAVKVSADTARSMPGGETGKRRQGR